MGVESFEQLLPDSRVERLSDLLRLVFPALPDDMNVVTFINPPGEIEVGGVRRWKPAEAVFALISDNPRNHIYRRRTRIMDHVAMLKATWDAEERARSHLVSAREDPAWKFLALAAREHLKRLANLRALN